MSLKHLLFLVTIFFNLIFQSESTILLYHLRITQINQTFTQTFTNAFQNFPIFAYFVEGGYIQNTQLSVTYDPARTTLTSTQMVINLYTYKPNAFAPSEFIDIGLLITDEGTKSFSIGVLTADISSTLTLNFPNLTLVNNNIVNGMLQVYCMSYPIVYTQELDMSSSNSLILSITRSATSYLTNVNFAFIYYSRSYVGQRVIATFKRMDEGHYAFTIPYQPFAYTPSAENVMFSLRQYDSTSIPFLNCPLNRMYDFITGVNPQMAFGYSFPAGIPTTFNSDIFFFNYTYTGCPDSQFLYYVQLYQTLPYSCIPCDPTCLHCATNTTVGPSSTDEYSCTACLWLRYLNVSSYGMGNCICLPGIEEVNGVCQQCQQSCLKFGVAYIQTTNTSNFLLQYSYGTVVELLELQNNLQVYINNVQVQFVANQQEVSYYIINLALTDMKVCEGFHCDIYFVYQYPQYVLIESQTQCLSNNNITVSIDNYIDYYSYVPNELQEAFNILGITIGMAFSGGYSSLVTILFQVEQLIDAHRYVNLDLPVVFNQLLMNMVYFRFLSILNLLPKSYSAQIQNSVPNDLDTVGPSRLLYYENGLNYYKNIIAALISVAALLAINFVIYLSLKFLPFKLAKKLAKKIEIRKLITIHDTIEQLELPCMYFALEQLQVMIIHPNLIWIYALAIFTTITIIVFPFLIILYIYNDKENKTKIEIYEDLLQDNSMNQKVTYIYYVFNYYRKIFFAMCLLSSLPGLVQIYLLVILNFLHLAFQVYLVVSRVYKSKMKIIIRFTNGFCIIAIEIMILLYNLNDYPKDTMINIGMACLYLTVVSTLMGILDVFVKIGDTCLQQLRSKHHEEEKKAIEKLKILKEFKNQIKCNIGDELQERPKDPKDIKFLQDKQLMENTFNKDNQSQRISVQLSDKGQSNGEGMDLVFIDDDWAQTYPYEVVNFKPKLNKQAGLFVKQAIKKDREQIELYQIPKQIGKQAKRVNENRIKRKKNKYQIDAIDEEILRKVETLRVDEAKSKTVSHRVKTKQTKDKSKADSLVVTISKHVTSQVESEASAISDTVSQQ